MKKKENQKIIYAYIPIGINNLEEMLSGTGLSFDRMKLLFHQLFLSRLRYAHNKTQRSNWLYTEGWVPIDSRILKMLLTQHYVRYLNWAEENNLIERRRDEITNGVKYVAGSYSQLIRIPKWLLHKSGTLRHFRKEQIIEYKAIKAVSIVRAEYKNRHEASKWYYLINNTHHAIMEMNRLVRFRLDEAEYFLNKKYNQAKTEGSKRLMQDYLQIIEAINDGSLDYFSVDAFGNRLHTPITGLYGELRPYMYFKNNPDEQLVHIDIRNSQIYLVSCIVSNPAVVEKVLPEFSLCRELLETYKNHDDVSSFYQDCCNGIIYESLAKGIIETTTDAELNNEEHETIRNKAKTKLISFLYSKLNSGNSNDEFKSLFQGRYPNVINAIGHIKSLGEKYFPFMKEFYTDKRTGKYVGDGAAHKNLSRMMQLMESRIILGMVSPSLIQSGLVPFVTIHDAFIVPLRNAQQVQTVIQETFRNIGLTPPRLKVIVLGKRSNTVSEINTTQIQ